MTRGALTKSSHDKKLAGVCGGLAEYFDVSPSLVRWGFVVLSICSAAFPGLLTYIVLAIVMPRA